MPEADYVLEGAGRPRDPSTEDRVYTAVKLELGECGFEAFTMCGVARRSGVARPNLLLRWPSRDDLILDTLTHLVEWPQPRPDVSARTEIEAIVVRVCELMKHDMLAIQLSSDRQRGALSEAIQCVPGSGDIEGGKAPDPASAAGSGRSRASRGHERALGCRRADRSNSHADHSRTRPMSALGGRRSSNRRCVVDILGAQRLMVDGVPVAEMVESHSAEVPAIDVGVYFDLRNPSRWAQNPSRLYGFTLEMCEEAERLGASSAWFSEHHLFDDGYLTSPLTLAAAVAARTRRIRLGTAILIAPLHNSAEIAEQSVVVDILSEGRLDLGIGTGYRVPEFALFGALMHGRYKQTDDTARRLRELWGPQGVRPAPVQEPVPIWMGYQGPQGARRAGLLGERLLSADGSLWAPYAAGLVEAGHSPSRGVMTGGIQGWVSDDPDRDWPMVREHLEYQVNSYRRHMVEGTGAPVPKPIDAQRLVESGRNGPLGSFMYGTPEDVAGKIRSYTSGAPVKTVFLWASIGGMPEAVVARNVHTICTRLAPLLRGGTQKIL